MSDSFSLRILQLAKTCIFDDDYGRIYDHKAYVPLFVLFCSRIDVVILSRC